MIILDVAHLSKAFGTDAVLKDVSLRLQTGDRLGLVGSNGSGKTTLLRLLTGELAPDEGNTSLARGLKLGYLSQVFHPRPGATVLEEALEAVSHLSRMEERLRNLEQQMGQQTGQALSSTMDEYARLTELYEAAGGYEAASQVQGVLSGLGFTAQQLQQEAATLSGGELTRLGLARLLLGRPDLLLLDEPTNHLDMAMLSWLEGFLKDYRGSVIVVSHDRYFLNAVCNCMAELLFGSLESYAGNYTAYMQQRDARFAARSKAFALQQREIQRQKAIIARFRSFNREKSIRAAESREKALERMELLDRPQEEKQVQFRFEPKRLLGDLALEAEGLQKAYGERQLFSDLNMHIQGGDRVALIGANGIGKTTLLRCLMGRENLDSGQVRFGPKAQLGYYDQRQQDLNPENDVLNEVWDAFPKMNQSQIRGALGLFLFSADDVFVPISLLSGGERARVSLVKLMLRRDNFLLLDEPTNHLDADSREALEKALEGYEGTILAVSHDRYFINRFANRVLELTEEGLVAYEGNYDDYLAAKQRLIDGENQAGEEKTRTEQAKERRADRQLEAALKALKEAVYQAETDTHKAEQAYNEAVARQAEPEVYTDPEKAASQAALVKQLGQQVDAYYQRWDQAEQALKVFIQEKGLE